MSNRRYPEGFKIEAVNTSKNENETFPRPLLMRVLFTVIMVSGCSMANGNTEATSEISGYGEERQALIEVLEEAVASGPSKSKFSDVVAMINERHKDSYLVKNFEPSKKDCMFWYGYHQIVSYIQENGTHESWPFVLSVVHGDRDISVGTYCMPPLEESEPVPKKGAN